MLCCIAIFTEFVACRNPVLVFDMSITRIGVIGIVFAFFMTSFSVLSVRSSNPVFLLLILLESSMVPSSLSASESGQCESRTQFQDLNQRHSKRFVQMAKVYKMMLTDYFRPCKVAGCHIYLVGRSSFRRLKKTSCLFLLDFLQSCSIP